MAVSEHGEAAGSVSGGCVESAVYEMAREALKTGEPAGETFAVGDEDAFAVGLPCGASLEIAVQAVGAKKFAQRSALADAVLPHMFAGPRPDAGTVPFLEVALRTPAACIGAMGSRRTHRDRMRRLREAGVPEAALARLCSPIGPDLGGRSAQETAVSIVAEIIALRSGGTGRAPSTTTAPIHRVDPRAVEPHELLAPT